MALDFVGLSFSLVAGASSIFSPCGFALYPGFVSYCFSSKMSTPRILFGSILSALAMIAVFGTIGIIASSVGGLVLSNFVILGMISGVAVILLGLAMLFELTLPVLKLPGSGVTKGGISGLFLYGLTYGIGSVGCSAPIFYSVLSLSLLSGGLVGGSLAFAVYGLGQSIPLILAAVLVSQGKGTLAVKAASLAPKLHKVIPFLLIGVGAYVLYYYGVVFTPVVTGKTGG
jgi:cytochrome c biogenesis protein CcdA